MQTVKVNLVNAFVDTTQGGNAAGIVLNAERYDQTTKQTIATNVGLSETAFISPSSVADFKLEFFTPTRQIAQCGHATIAAYVYLAQQGLLTKKQSSMETVDGTRLIVLDDAQAFMEQTAPTFTPPDSLAPEVSQNAILESLGLSPAELLNGLSPLVVNTGNSFLIVPVESAGIVQRVVPDQSAVKAISEKLGLVGYYIFSPTGQKPGRDAGTRMFAPAYGIAEEAATGMAAGPLACYLHEFLPLKKTTFLIEQGHLMHPPSPSVLTVRLHLEHGVITGLMVGGRAQVSHRVEIGIESVS